MSAEVVIQDRGRDDLDSLLALYRHLHEHDDPLPDRSELRRFGTKFRDTAQILSRRVPGRSFGRRLQRFRDSESDPWRSTVRGD